MIMFWLYLNTRYDYAFSCYAPKRLDVQVYDQLWCRSNNCIHQKIDLLLIFLDFLFVNNDQKALKSAILLLEIGMTPLWNLK